MLGLPIQLGPRHSLGCFRLLAVRGWTGLMTVVLCGRSWRRRRGVGAASHVAPLQTVGRARLWRGYLEYGYDSDASDPGRSAEARGARTPCCALIAKQGMALGSLSRGRCLVHQHPNSAAPLPGTDDNDMRADEEPIGVELPGHTPPGRPVHRPALPTQVRRATCPVRRARHMHAPGDGWCSGRMKRRRCTEGQVCSRRMVDTVHESEGGSKFAASTR